MMRSITALAVLTAFANLASACPLCCPCRQSGLAVYYPCQPYTCYPQSRPMIVYYYYPPPAVVVTEPPAVVVTHPPKPEQKPRPFDRTALYENVVKSCVYIITPNKEGFLEGSGSLIDVEQRLVLTSYFAVNEENSVFVLFPVYVKGELIAVKEKYRERVHQGLAIKGKVLFRDKTRELALIKLDRMPPGTPAIPLAKTGPRPGAPVWQIGNAVTIEGVFGASQGEVMAVGPLRSLSTGDPDDNLKKYPRMVMATNPVNRGDWGGPLYDKRGYLVAVTVGGNTKSALCSYFVDVTEVRAFLAEKKVKGKELSDEPEPTKSDQSVDDGKAAADMLRRAKLFADLDTPVYINKLREIVKRWPDLPAGKEAKKLLENLK